MNYQELEELAAQLCRMSGGDWSKRYTKRQLWRWRALMLHAMAHGDDAEISRLKAARP